MPVFHKRKRKNDEKYGLWGILTTALVIAMIASALGLFFVEQDSDETMRSASTVHSTNRIGLYVGHHHNDTARGVVCADGLTEREINGAVADQLRAELLAQGYAVDMFYDKGAKLNGYRADLLISIHVYGCMNDIDSGYRSINISDDSALDRCMREYEAATSLERLENPAYTNDYTRFYQTAESTPVMTIELGMLEADRYLLTQQQDRVVSGLANTINCFSPVQLESDDTTG